MTPKPKATKTATRRPPIKVVSVGQPTALAGLARLLLELHRTHELDGQPTLSMPAVPFPFTAQQLAAWLLDGRGIVIYSAVRGVYNRAEYAAQRRDMLQQWADYIESLVSTGRVILGRFKQVA